jgi:hypothetical protein
MSIVRIITLTAGLALVAQAEPGKKPAAVFPKKNFEVIDKYCIDCHDAGLKKGKVNLEDLSFDIHSIEQAELWQKVYNAVGSGEMPPEDEDQLQNKEKADFLDDLANTMVVARKSLSDTGGQIAMRRLNRREYGNTIHDLLGVTLDITELPADGGGGTFDTVGGSQFVSSDQIEQYLVFGRAAIDEAFRRRAMSNKKPAVVRIEPEKAIRSGIEKEAREIEEAQKRFSRWKVEVDKAVATPANQKRLPELVKQNKKMKSPIHFYKFVELLDGVPPAKKYGFEDAFEATLQHPDWDRSELAIRKHYMTLPHRDKGLYLKLAHGIGRLDISPKKFIPGTYRLRVRVGAVEDAPASRRFIEVGHPYSKPIAPGRMALEGTPISQHQITGSIAKPQIIESTFELKATDPKIISVRERQPLEAKALWGAHKRLKQKNSYGHPPAIWIDWLELEGPIAPATPPAMDWWVSEKEIKEPMARARKILEQFSLEAMRGSAPSKDYIDRLIGIFQTRRKAGENFEVAIRTPMSIVIASPGFLYLHEPGSENTRRALDDRELAVRLAYFLWSAPPDSQLLSLAKQGELKKPAVLKQQVSRLIADPRADAFVAGFVHQWLHMERLDFFQFDPNRHREFDESMRSASRQEVYQTFAHLMRGQDPEANLGLMLKSDYVMINGLLANYYGIEGVVGDEFRKVKLSANSPRGGLLGMAATHAMGSDGIESSPVERGAWVLRYLLNDPPPPAPPNIPQLSRLADKPLSTRDKVLAHQTEGQCASCHRKIDPIGFGLENFDAAGKWRTTEIHGVKKKNKTFKIDPTGQLYKGPAFANYFELRDIIAGRDDDFIRGYCEALIEYGLGRPASIVDTDLVNEMMAAAKTQDNAASAFIHALVQSEAFRRK